jgi:tRNA/rRNA methyltransferase
MSKPLPPAIILVEPQLAMNIGTAARAMANCGLFDLRLVRPRPSWPSEMARRASSGAEAILEKAGLFETTQEAIADLERVYATTGRSRKLVKTIVTPKRAAAEIHEAARLGLRSGLLYGPERTGLENDDLALADAVIAVPLNPDFSSLNLAQAVLVTAYEWYQSVGDRPEIQLAMGDGKPATKADLEGFFRHLETELDDCGFLRVAEKRPGMLRNIRNIFQRAQLTTQEVRTLHGIVTELVTRRKRGS